MAKNKIYQSFIYNLITAIPKVCYKLVYIFVAFAFKKISGMFVSAAIMFKTNKKLKQLAKQQQDEIECLEHTITSLKEKYEGFKISYDTPIKEPIPQTARGPILFNGAGN